MISSTSARHPLPSSRARPRRARAHSRSMRSVMFTATFGRGRPQLLGQAGALAGQRGHIALDEVLLLTVADHKGNEPAFVLPDPAHAGGVVPPPTQLGHDAADAPALVDQQCVGQLHDGGQPFVHESLAVGGRVAARGVRGVTTSPRRALSRFPLSVRSLIFSRSNSTMTPETYPRRLADSRSSWSCDVSPYAAPDRRSRRGCRWHTAAPRSSSRVSPAGRCRHRIGPSVAVPSQAPRAGAGARDFQYRRHGASRAAARSTSVPD